MTIEKLREQTETMLEQLEALSTKLEDVRNYAQEATSDASNAEDYAANARSEADQADDYACEAEDLVRDLNGTYSDICALIDQLDPQGTQEGSGASLTHDIAANKRMVLKYKSAGHSPEATAKGMGISLTLVKVILEGEARAA